MPTWNDRNIIDANAQNVEENIMRFDGATYQPELDFERLSGQHRRTWILMNDGRWRTFNEISAITGDPPASISARLRDFRKIKFGGHVVNRRRRGEPGSGLFEYQVLQGRNLR